MTGAPVDGGPGRRVVRAPNHLGDAVMALPALAEHQGDVMARGWLTPLLEMAGLPGRILGLEPGWRGWRQAVSTLRGARYSGGTLLTPSFSSAWLFRWGGIHDLRGTASDGRSWMLRDRLDRKELLAHHRIDQYRVLMGGEPGPDPVHFPLRAPAHEVDAWRQRLGPAGIQVALFPGSNAPARRWAADRFAAVARALLGQGCGVVVLGGGGERALTGAVADGAPGAVNLGGGTDLGGLAAVLAACRVVVSNDTGPMHLAAALGTSTVTLWGPSDPAEVAPPGPAHARVSGQALPCGPCFKHHCPRTGSGTLLAGGHEECMNLIDVDPVVRAVQALLERETP